MGKPPPIKWTSCRSCGGTGWKTTQKARKVNGKMTTETVKDMCPVYGGRGVILQG